MFIPRLTGHLIKEKSKHYPIVAITGPRQSGKSTLVRTLFPDKIYCNLEDLTQRQFAQEDPRGFLAQFPQGAILDEVQHCPDLFSYLQAIVDEKKKLGDFILTGSQQFGLVAKISQSLAGRVGFIQLLPFSLIELQNAKQNPNTVEDMLFKGFYPPIFDRNIPPTTWYNDYTMTYLERDVRQLINIQDLRIFHRFLQMCAARTGQLLNLSSLANDCGITHNTAKAWISLLETSYIVFLISPHFQNYNKRLIKSPKLYFYDTGLVCALLNIQQPEQLIPHPMKGALFETWVMSELIKNRFNNGYLSNLYFWRDSQGHEIDILVENGTQLIPIEVKAGQTISSQYFDDLKYWLKLSGQSTKGWVLYTGNDNSIREEYNVLAWQNIRELLAKVILLSIE